MAKEKTLKAFIIGNPDLDEDYELVPFKTEYVPREGHYRFKGVIACVGGDHWRDHLYPTIRRAAIAAYKIGPTRRQRNGKS